MRAEKDGKGNIHALWSAEPGGCIILVECLRIQPVSARDLHEKGRESCCWSADDGGDLLDRVRRLCLPHYGRKNLFAPDRKPPSQQADPSHQSNQPGIQPKAIQLDGVFIHGDTKKALIRLKEPPAAEARRERLNLPLWWFGKGRNWRTTRWFASNPEVFPWKRTARPSLWVSLPMEKWFLRLHRPLQLQGIHLPAA